MYVLGKERGERGDGQYYNKIYEITAAHYIFLSFKYKIALFSFK